MTIGTAIVDGEEMLIKSPIPAGIKSVCVEDFEGYTNPGHFHTSFWADYYPELGFTRFGGDHWNVPDMPSTSEPTEDAVNAWAVAHNFGIQR